jgi:hypothetical protein
MVAEQLTKIFAMKSSKGSEMKKVVEKRNADGIVGGLEIDALGFKLNV